MLGKQLGNLSRLTTTTLTYATSGASSLFSLVSTGAGDESTGNYTISPELLAFWISDTKRGLEAFFNDQFDTAASIFAEHAAVSPFHAVGQALIAYLEAILGFESDKIQVALDHLAAAEYLARQYSKRARRKSGKLSQVSASDTESVTSSQRHSAKSVDISDEPLMSTGGKKGRRAMVAMHFDLLEACCVLMSATIQFLRNNWIECLRGAYKLRKSYKMFEHMFESLTDQKTSEYWASVNKNSKANRNQHRNSDTPTGSRQARFPKRFHHLVASLPSGADSLPHGIARLSFGWHNEGPSHWTGQSNDTLRSGVFFGVGLFSLVLSLLPPKVGRHLNSLGFQSSRPFAIHLLQQSYESNGMFSSLSALALLAYYTNLAHFVPPCLHSGSLKLQNAQSILERMLALHPQGTLWKLMKGKLLKMLGDTRRGVEILRDMRCESTANAKAHLEKDTADTTPSKHSIMYSGLNQLQALAFYEMGWGQVILGDYYQASETFFRLEGMTNWSRAFYHYVASCCIFADDAYDKAAKEFTMIIRILDHKRAAGIRLLPNEIFAERRLRQWNALSESQGLDGPTLKRIVRVNPLWELVYLWNGMSQLSTQQLRELQKQMQDVLSYALPCERARMFLFLGVVSMELGDLDMAEFRLNLVVQNLEAEDPWAVPYAMYELATVACRRVIFTSPDTSQLDSLLKTAHTWVRRAQQCYRRSKHTSYSNNSASSHSLLSTSTSTTSSYSSSYTASEHQEADWESRLHVRCQLVLEKLHEFSQGQKGYERDLSHKTGTCH